MVLGAIIVVGAEDGLFAQDPPGGGNDRPPLPESLACVEVLGRSLIELVAERFVKADVETISVLVHTRLSSAVPVFQRACEQVRVQVVDDLEFAIAQTLKQFAENGVDFAFITDANTYTGCDLIDLLWFHRGTRQAITRTFDRDGGLNLWVCSCAKTLTSGLAWMASKVDAPGSESYFISDYVNRLAHFKNLRSLVEDVLRGHCETRPFGQEIRPGVWVADGAQIHKRARIVAPTFIGSGATIGENCVVTRCSNIERNCYIDSDTVIQDSSILPNSYVGISLDVAHAVVQENRLWDLRRGVKLEMSDPSVIRSSAPVWKRARGQFGIAPAPASLAIAPVE